MLRFIPFLLLALYPVCLSIPHNEAILSSKEELYQAKIVQWLERKGKVTKNVAKLVHDAVYIAREKHVDPLLFISLVYVESRFEVTAKSQVGAIGLTQVLPKWHKVLINGRNLYDPKTNMEIGASILKEYHRWHRNMRKALAQYNGTLGEAKYPNKVFAVRESLYRYVNSAS